MRQPQTETNPCARRRFWYRALVATVLLLLAALLYLGDWRIGKGGTPSQPVAADVFFRCPCPQIFAHRGASAYRPENTLPAFRLALQMGADVLELDVHLSVDGRVVVFHDRDLQRVTGVVGRVTDLSYAAIRALDAGARFRDAQGRRAFAGRGVRIPLLSDVLRAFPRMRMNIELKDKDPALAQAVEKLLRAARAHERVMVNSVHDSAMDVWMRLGRSPQGLPGPPGPVGAATFRVLSMYLAYTLGFQHEPTVNALQIPAERTLGIDLTGERFMDFAHWRGVRVHYWTVNDPQQMKLLVGRGADGIITDRPDVAFQALRSLGLRSRATHSRKN